MSLRGGRRTRGIANEDPRIVGLGSGGGEIVTPDPCTITLTVDDPIVIASGTRRGGMIPALHANP